MFLRLMMMLSYSIHAYMLYTPIIFSIPHFAGHSLIRKDIKYKNVKICHKKKILMAVPLSACHFFVTFLENFKGGGEGLNNFFLQLRLLCYML